jgi:diaminobutyrate-2-oxoglutarate transaminase
MQAAMSHPPPRPPPCPDTPSTGGVATACRAGLQGVDAVFDRAVGSVLIDQHGRRTIDFSAGRGELAYGHNDRDLVAALTGHLQAQGLAAAPGLPTAARQAFVASFSHRVLAPRGLDHRVLLPGHTPADTLRAALQLARQATGRQGVITFTHGGHGLQLGTLATQGNRHDRLGALLPGVHRVAYDGFHGAQVDTAAQLERLLEDGAAGVPTPAAIVVETLQADGGHASRAWLRRIAALARRHGSWLLVDDMQAGCGRTGGFFSFEPMDIVPDGVLLSQGLSGLGLPLSALLLRPALVGPAEASAVEQGAVDGLALVTATAALEKFWADDRLATQVARRAQAMAAVLAPLAARWPAGRLRGRGMLLGLDVGHGGLAERIARRCLALGLLVDTVGARGQVLRLTPPLTTPDPLLDQGLQRLVDAVDWSNSVQSVQCPPGDPLPAGQAAGLARVPTLVNAA